MTQDVTGYFVVEAPRDGLPQEIPSNASVVVDSHNQELVAGGLYLLLHRGQVLARRYARGRKHGRFVAGPPADGEVPWADLPEGRPSVFGRIVSSIVEV